MNNKKKNAFSLFDYFFELVAWVLIVLSPLLLSVLIACLVYGFIPNAIGLAIGILLLIVGLVLGILWANLAWRQSGTMVFISRIYASPELDGAEKSDWQEP